ncbi:MAG TPA: HdeD family acid-resistance protein [Thermoleophilia bacterium]|nr:HdeD family acid-resistance protein [Thermoleophilia bacterium]
MKTLSRATEPDEKAPPDDVRRDLQQAENVFFRPFDVARRGSERATGYWWLYVLLGLVSIAVGVFALASQIDAVSTLVALVGALLVCTGAVELWLGVMSRPSSPLAIVAGAAWITLGVVALAWPKATLSMLVLFVGIGLLARGAYDVYLSLEDAALRPRSVDHVLGIALVALGAVALARPTASGVVLGILVGLFFVFQGVFSLVAGLRLSGLHSALTRIEKGMRTGDKTGPEKAARSKGIFTVNSLRGDEDR